MLVRDEQTFQPVHSITDASIPSRRYTCEGEKSPWRSSRGCFTVQTVYLFHMKPDTKTRILEAASRVVQKSGVAHMTLEEVAAEAKVSKGGLLYHFSSKEALIKGLVDEYIAQFDQFLDGHKKDTTPGSFTRAYLESALFFDAASCVGIVSAIANDTSLLAPLHKAYARWQFRLEHDGIDPTLATMVRLVADGLWFSFLIGTPALDEVMVKRILEQLEAETRTNGVKRDITQ